MLDTNSLLPGKECIYGEIDYSEINTLIPGTF